MASSWPLVARDGELRRLVAAVRDAAVRGVVVRGPAGVGKTRLLRAAVDEVARGGVTPRWVQASQSAASLPFGAVAHLVPDVSDARASQLEVLQRARAALLAEDDYEAKRDSRAVVLAVDDAHLLDAASAALIGYLVASSTGTVLLTLRSGACVPDVIQGLVRNEQVERLELDVLGSGAVGELLARVLGGQVDTAAIRRLWRLSEGNPLLLRELVDAALRHGSLREQHGLWRLADLPGSAWRLGDLVGARLAELEGRGYEAATVLALGEPLEAALLEALADPAGVGEIERTELLGRVPDVEWRRQQVRLVHPLYAEALRATVAPLQARALYRRLADALQATGVRRRGDVLRLATWRLEAGQGGDSGVFLAAAKRARVAFDYRLAERLARAALQAGAGFDAKLTLSFALHPQGRVREAQLLLADWKSEAASDDERAQAVFALASWQPARSEALLSELEALTTNRAARDHLLAARANTLLLSRWRVRDALMTVKPLMAAPRNDRTAAVAALTAVAAEALAGRSDRALAIAHAVLARQVEGEEFIELLEDLLLAWSCLAHIVAGQGTQAQRLAADGHQRAMERRSVEAQAFWALADGIRALIAGEVATARGWLREAAALSRSRQPSASGLVVTWSLGCLAEAAALQGDVAIAESALAEAHGDQALPAEVPVASRQLGRVWLTAARGETTAARELAAAAAQAQRDAGAYAFEMIALHDAVRLGADGAELRRHVERLEHLIEHVDGSLVRAFAQHARALLDHDTAGMQDALAKFEQLGVLLYAAEAAAQLAALHAHAGRQSSAHAAAERAHILASHCEGARTPVLTRAGQPLPLTPREREIASLAAQGLSNKQIAERLVISVRTADNHLHRAYQKLGITSRSELKAIIAP